MPELTCFKAYDIRGEISVNIYEDITYRIGRALVQHFSVKSVMIDFDTCKTRPVPADAVTYSVINPESNALNIGMARTRRLGPEGLKPKGLSHL